MKKIKFLLVAMIATLGLALSVPQVFANNDYHVSIYGDGNQDHINLFETTFGAQHFNLAKGEEIAISGTTFRYNGQRLDITDIKESSIHLKNVKVRASGDPEPERWWTTYFDRSFTLGKDEYISLNNNTFRIGTKHFDLTRIDRDNQLSIYIEPIGIRPEDSVPAISGEHTVIANVDSPYTVDRIKEIAELAATDEYYGDLTDQIEVVSDNYTENATKVGNYEIEFKVTNDSNLSTTFKLMVAVKDLTAPVITGPATSEISYTEVLNLEAFLTDFTVTDNHDETVLLKVDSNTYTGNETKPGTYQIKLSATDTSNNKGTFTHTIKVIDDVKPNFVDEHSGKIQVNWRDRIDDNFLLLDLTANDKIDGDLTNNIKIVDRGGLKNELGSYNVKYEVTDAAGNKATYTRKYEIITTDAPVFWVSKNLLLISDVNILTNDQLANELASYENIKMASFVMIQNDYSGNEDIPGEYEVKLAIADTDGTEHQISRTIRVFAEEDMPEAEPNFLDKVINFFVNIWNMIVKVFMWFVNAIKWLWNLIFGWVN